MANITNHFLKPNTDGIYYAQQSQIIHGLWTPLGIVLPLFIGIWPNGGITITYNTRKGAKFTKAQKRKIKYIKARGVEVNITHEGYSETSHE
jgi:hypothetical protein